MRIYRVVVLDNGGSGDRDLVVEPGAPAPETMELETGAWIPAPFHAPTHGVYRHYLSKSGANGRAEMLRLNGCVVEVQASDHFGWGDDV